MNTTSTNREMQICDRDVYLHKWRFISLTLQFSEELLNGLVAHIYAG